MYTICFGEIKMELDKIVMTLIVFGLISMMTYLQIQTQNEMAVTLTSTITEKDYNYAGEGIFVWWFHMANGDWTKVSNSDYYHYNIGDNYTYTKNVGV